MYVKYVMNVDRAIDVSKW